MVQKNREEAAAWIEDEIQRWMKEYCTERSLTYVWRRPVVRFGDAQSPLFEQLAKIVIQGHHTPKEYLPEASVVISYFLPFIAEIGEGNVEGELASRQWADAYNVTNTMAGQLNDHLVRWLQKQGYQAAVPTDTGMISDDVLYSRWSQKHVGYICGQGTFGVNNMLISDKGCVGRYFSIVADLPVEAHSPVTEERCLYRRSGRCLLCVKRCVGDALKLQRQEIQFDQVKCLAQCRVNTPIVGAGVCGKCVVGLPCSYKE